MNTTSQTIHHTPASPWSEVQGGELSTIEGGTFLGDLPVIVVKAVQALAGLIIGDPVPTPKDLV